MPNSDPASPPKPLTIEDILEVFEEGSDEAIAEICRIAHPGDIETAFERLDDEERGTVLKALPADLLSDLSDYLPSADFEKRVRTLPEEEKREVLDAMSDDELVDLLQEVPEKERPEYLELLPEEKQALSEDLLQFDEDSAGGRMTTAFAKVNEHLTVREALAQLEAQREEPEMLSRIYVVDDGGRLLGKIRLRDLAFNPRKSFISEIMDRDRTAILATAEQEAAADMIARYDLMALPVTDDQGRLLGIVTHDDALDIIQEEVTEDIERASGIGGERDMAYIQTPVTIHLRRRFGWVLAMALLGMISGYVLHTFESVFKAHYVLALYLPMVVAAGGNTGAQAATMVIRALSLGELTPSEFFHVVWKEMRVGLMLGGLLGLCIALQIRFLLPAVFSEGATGSLLQIASVVGLALTAQVATSTSIGAILPLGARAIRLDPAVVASPAITTLVDVTGLIIYFSLARVLLPG